MLPANPGPVRCRALFALFSALRAGQALHFLLLILILPDFSICCAQIGDEQAEHFLLLVLRAANRGSGLSWRQNPGRRLLLVRAPTAQLRCAVVIGPLISPGFRVNATEALPAMEPISGTWPSGSTKSLVFIVAPSSLAAFFRSCSALARSDSSWVFWASRVAARSFLNSSSTRLRISSKVGVAAA